MKMLERAATSKTKRTVSILLAIGLIILSLAGCGQSGASTASAGDQISDAAASEISSQASTADDSELAAANAVQDVETDSLPVEENEGEVENTATIDYPLTGDNLELSYWIPFESMFFSAFFDTYRDAPITPVLEEKTGVHLNFLEVSSESVNETFNLMVASGDLPDLFSLMGDSESRYVGGPVRAAEDDIIIDLTDMIEENAPDYYRVMNSKDDYTKKFLVTEDDRILQIYQLNDHTVYESGLLARTDWIVELGYDGIDTIDKLTSFLKDAKKKYNPKYTLELGSTALATNIVGAFHTVGYEMDGNDIAWQRDGDVLEAGCASEEYRDYLEWLIDLYNEGVINKDFYNSTTSESRQTYQVFADGDIAVAPDVMADLIDSVYSEFSDDSQKVDGYSPIVQTEGETYSYKTPKALLGRTSLVISTACQIPEIALQYLNYGFTEEGSIICNYGTEGVSFEYDENGEPQYTEYITNNPNYGTMMIRNVSNALYTPMLYFTEALFFTYSDSALNAMSENVWGNYTSDNAVPEAKNLSYTADESTEYSHLIFDITTYVSEQVGRWIIGEAELNDETWNQYLENLDSMNLEQATEIAQSAYNSFWGIK